jgi:hypothetical protein
MGVIHLRSPRLAAQIAFQSTDDIERYLRS